MNDLLCIAILASRYQNNDGANLKKKERKKAKVRISNLSSCMKYDTLHHTPTSFHELLNILSKSLLSLTSLSFSFYMLPEFDSSKDNNPSTLPSMHPGLEMTKQSSSSSSQGKVGEKSAETTVCEEFQPAQVTFHPGPPPIQPWEQPALTHCNQEPAHQV